MYNIHAQTQLPISQAKVGEPFSEKLFFSTRGTRLGQNLKFFFQKLLLMTPLRKKIKEQRCETADSLLCSSCEFFTKIQQSVGDSKHLSITKEYLLHSWQLSYFPPPADPLPISAGCSFAIVPIYFAEPAELSICLPSTSCVA